MHLVQVHTLLGVRLLGVRLSFVLGLNLQVSYIVSVFTLLGVRRSFVAGSHLQV